MYDKSGGGTALRKYLSCNLAYWHSYKQATKMIWKAFANTIWARMWHRMYPGSKFKVINPSPQEAAMHMVYMARAYPYFKSELEAANDQGSLFPSPASPPPLLVPLGPLPPIYLVFVRFLDPPVLVLILS